MSGSRPGRSCRTVTTVAKYFGLLFIVVLAIAVGLPRETHGANFTPIAPPVFRGGRLRARPGLGALGLRRMGGPDVRSGEIKDPRRNLPRALLLGTGRGDRALPLWPNVGYLSVLSIQDIRTSKLVAADTAARLIGSGGVLFVSLTVMLSTFGTLNGSILTSPRVFFAMADRECSSSNSGKVHPRFKTPSLAIVLTATLGVVFVMLRTFEQLADTFVTAIIPFYALGVASIFVFRKRADFDPSFRTPLYPLTPILFVLAILYLLGNALIDESSRWPTLAILRVILAGIPIYYLTVARRALPAATAED